MIKKRNLCVSMFVVLLSVTTMLAGCNNKNTEKTEKTQISLNTKLDNTYKRFTLSKDDDSKLSLLKSFKLDSKKYKNSKYSDKYTEYLNKEIKYFSDKNVKYLKNNTLTMEQLSSVSKEELKTKSNAILEYTKVIQKESKIVYGEKESKKLIDVANKLKVGYDKQLDNLNNVQETVASSSNNSQSVSTTQDSETVTSQNTNTSVSQSSNISTTKDSDTSVSQSSNAPTTQNNSTSAAQKTDKSNAVTMEKAVYVAKDYYKARGESDVEFYPVNLKGGGPYQFTVHSLSSDTRWAVIVGSDGSIQELH